MWSCLPAVSALIQRIIIKSIMKDESTSISQANEERESPQLIERKWKKNERLTHDQKEHFTNHIRCQLGVLKEMIFPSSPSILSMSSRLCHTTAPIEFRPYFANGEVMIDDASRGKEPTSVPLTAQQNFLNRRTHINGDLTSRSKEPELPH